MLKNKEENWKKLSEILKVSDNAEIILSSLINLLKKTVPPILCLRF